MSEFDHVRTVEAVLSCVRAPDLGCFDMDACWRYGFCGFTRDETRRRMQSKPDPKPVPRIKDPKACRRKVQRERTCRCGCGRPATDGHHILPRSLGGDDVEANIMGLFHDDHMVYEFGGEEDRREMAALLGSRLQSDEIRYVTVKRGLEAGEEFLRRYYHRDLNDAERADLVDQLDLIRREGESY